MEEFKQFWMEWKNVEYILFIIEHQPEKVRDIWYPYFDLTSGESELLLEMTLHLAKDNFIQEELTKSNGEVIQMTFPLFITKHGLKLHNILHRSIKSRFDITIGLCLIKALKY